MRESRSLKIVKKSFTIENIRHIASYFLNEYSKSHVTNNKCRLTYSINCIDDTSYESETMSILNDGEIITIKKAKNIDFTFYDYTLDQSIFFSISEGNSRSFLKVQGNDETWVKNIFIKITEYIDSLGVHENTYMKYKELFRHIIALGMGKLVLMIITSFLGLFWQPEINVNSSETLIKIREFFQNNILISYLILDWIVPWLYGLTIVKNIVDRISDLWPNVEFDFGPEHTRKYKQFRNRLNGIITMFLVPSLIMIIYDLVKGMF